MYGLTGSRVRTNLLSALLVEVVGFDSFGAIEVSLGGEADFSLLNFSVKELIEALTSCSLTIRFFFSIKFHYLQQRVQNLKNKVIILTCL